MYELINKITHEIIVKYVDKETAIQQIRDGYKPEDFENLFLQLHWFYKSQPYDKGQPVGALEEIEQTKPMPNEELFQWAWPEVYLPAPILKVNKNDFMCDCSPAGKYRADSVIAEAKRTLTHKHNIVGDSNLLTAIVYALNWNLKLKDDRVFASIEAIHNDQWCAVVAKAESEEYGTTFSTYIQCDRVEAGIAATWLAMKQRFELTDEEMSINIEDE